jgi:hypothetical protein
MISGVSFKGEAYKVGENFLEFGGDFLLSSCGAGVIFDIHKMIVSKNIDYSMIIDHILLAIEKLGDIPELLSKIDEFFKNMNI